ncbi:MAG: orotidine-5'-phosphate decarboxylase [Gammaproteobacteria bacterium]|nr:orotidine-5'-phosphate decarboxylase [Gammaproteobacteria bacterium]MBT8150007.1 orotidine-5'-phosphate decarboxylase [Gammaproteobacteria bacterium]NND40137.1 orotidine-5'-phosphate decarboxylase [Pseudomonadales bacterium]RZV49575.1 MAG: orotidine-5'-phosphate decarboxylase [Pseudomonadales bacterium]
MPENHLQVQKSIPAHERLMFALDVPGIEPAKKLVEELGDSVTFYKIGLELLMAGNYFELLAWLIEKDKKVFADLKFFDVPQTVASAVKQLSQYGATFCTVHGNDSILKAAVEASGDSGLGILAVTALTSLDQGDIEDLGFKADVQQIVLSRARRALELGCAGVISSGLEAPALREHVDNQLLVITPGIRPVANVDDQKRTVDVEQAFANGADYIVVGRPIKNHEGYASPRAAAEDIQARITKVFT